jgi:hypothetical protein
MAKRSGAMKEGEQLVTLLEGAIALGAERTAERDELITALHRLLWHLRDLNLVLPSNIDLNDYTTKLPAVTRHAPAQAEALLARLEASK